MATNFDSDSNYENPFNDILRNAGVLSPIGVGAAVGLKRLQSNNSISPSRFGMSTPLGRLGSKVGDSLKQADTINQGRQLQKARDFASSLLESSGIESLLGEIQEQNAVIQALNSALDDPASGLDSATISGFKDRLSNAAERVADGADVQKILGSMIQEVYNNNEPGLSVLQSRLREFKGLGDQLTTPGFNIKAGQPFIKLNSQRDLTGSAAGRFSRLNSMVGGGNYFVEAVQSTEHTGAVGQYARVMSRGRGKGGDKLVTMLPLDLNSAGKSGLPYNIVRTGAAGTAYRADRYLIDARKAINTISGRANASLSLSDLRKAGAVVGIEDYYLNSFQQQVDSAGGLFKLNRNTFNASIREILAGEHRYASSGGVLGSHLRSQGKFQSNVARLVGLEGLPARQRLSLLEAASRGSEFDLGVGADRLAEQNIAGRVSSLIGLKEGSGFGAMRTGFEGLRGMSLNRKLEPIVGRAEQTVNRISQASIFTPLNGPRGRGLSGQLGAGGQNILWDKSLTGTTNKAVLMDVGVGATGKARGFTTGKIYNALNGTGQAFHMGSDLVRSAGTIPIMDPRAHGQQSSQLLERIMSMKAGEMLSLTPDEIASHKGFVGVGSSGAKYLPKDPRMKGMRIGWQSMTEAAGKSTIHLVYEMDRRLETMKLFGRLQKGTVVEANQGHLRGLLSNYGMSSKELSSYGFDQKQTLIGSGEMLKKAPASFMRQMTTGFGMVSGVEDWQGAVRKQADMMLQGQISDFGLGNVGGKVNPLGVTTAAVLRSLKANNVDPTKAGRVLSAIYNRGMNNDDSWLKGQQKGLRLDSVAFESAVKSVYKGGANALLDSASKGIAIGADTFALGEGVGDWRQGRGSIEPRLVENLQARFNDMGMSLNQSSDVIASLYKRKIGFGEHLRVASSMKTMAESIKGVRSITSELPGSGKPTRLGVGQVVDALNSGTHKNLGEYLRTFDDGVIVDLKNHSDVRVQAAMRSAAENVFGGQGEIFLPGGKAMDAMSGTFIKTVGDINSVAIGSEYERLAQRLGEDLQASTGANKISSESFEKAFQNFSKQGVSLAANSFQQVTSGRIRGSSYNVAAVYDLNHGVGLTSRQQKLVSETVAKTKGTALFVDDHGFLSMLNDSIGSGNQYNTAGNKTINAVKDGASKLDMFFTGMEGSIGERKGLASIASRHPILSRGNVAVSQIFRHVGAVGAARGTDETFAAISNTSWGKKAIAKFNGKVGSFRDIARSGDHKSRKNFFSQFANNLKEFAGHEGGGRVFMPKAQFDVHYGSAGKVKVDFGLASQAGGDFDGDQWSLFMLDKRAGSTVMSTLDGVSDDYLKADTLYKIKSEIFAEEAKGALSNLAKEQGELGVSAMAYQDALKEKASKEATGMIDVSLNELRRAAINMPGATQEAISSSLALLKVLEEHTTIKGKKLPVYHPYAEKMTNAVDTMMKSGDSSPFRRVMGELFKGSPLLGDGVSVGAVDSPDVPYIHKGVTGSSLRLDDQVDFIAKSANSARSQFSRYASGGSGNQLAAAIRHGGATMMSAFRDIFQADSSLQAGMVNAGSAPAEKAYTAFGSIGDQIMRATSSVNRKAGAAIVAGFGASAVAAFALGGSGYDPEPLIPSTEQVSPHIKNAMATSQVMNFPTGGGGPSTDEFARQGDRYAMMERPINTGSTYMEKPNTYQIRIEAQSPHSFANAANYMSQMPGMSRGASVSINDTRRPITGNYLDRLVGEY